MRNCQAPGAPVGTERMWKAECGRQAALECRRSKCLARSQGTVLPLRGHKGLEPLRVVVRRRCDGRPIDDLPGVSFDGAVGVRDGVSRAMNDVVSVHHGFTPNWRWSRRTRRAASGLWKTASGSAAPGLIVHGFGHYHECYTRIEGHWRFRSVELHRLRVETRNANPALPENR